MSQTSLSKHDFNHLLGRVCSISDPTVKLQTFELTFDNIQLGDWTKDEWEKFTHKLFDLHPKVNTILENKVLLHYANEIYVQFVHLVITHPFFHRFIY